ncbi:hypothetical protein D3C72_1737880 [compost metagenome]
MLGADVFLDDAEEVEFKLPEREAGGLSRVGKLGAFADVRSGRAREVLHAER